MQRRKCNILYIGNKLADRGHTPTGIDILGPALEGLGYKVRYAGSKVGKLLRLVQMLAAIVRYKNNTDVVLIDTYSTSAFYYAYVCAVVCRAFGIRYIPILHGGNLPKRFEQSPALCKALFGNSYTNIAVSGYLANTLKQYRYPCHLIENSLDLSQYIFQKRVAVVPHLLWVRSFHEIYHPQMAIHVIAGILKQHPNAKLTMVGPDKDGSLQKCKTLAANLRVDTHVHFTGKLDKEAWIALSKGCDVFINTSSVDNTPVSVIEAMALGMPIVSTNAGGLPFLLSQHNSIMVGVNDVEAMTAAILSLIANKERVSELSLSARHTAAQYDWAIIKQKWIALFDQLGHA